MIDFKDNVAVLVNNVGYLTYKKHHLLEIEQIMAHIHVNVTPMALITKMVLPGML